MPTLSDFSRLPASVPHRIRQSRHRAGHGRHGSRGLGWHLFLTRRQSMSNKTFFITGVSSGFGLALSCEALSAGHRVIGTVRSEEARHDFEALSEEYAHAVLLDITDIGAIPDAVADAESRFGPVDVLVNNAGYGHEG